MTMRPKSWREWRRAGLWTAVCLAGCGIDQGGVRSPTFDEAQVVVVSGPITGFGSVLVNGLTLDTARTQIRVDGGAGAQADLRVGQVIRAVAVSSGGTLAAVSIDYEENVRGAVTALDLRAGDLVVLGQQVHVDTRTRFAPPLTRLADVQVGAPLAVSGIVLPTGEIQATYIGPAAANDAQVARAITALDSARLELDLGDLKVDYSRAVLLELPAGQPALGLVVEVTGAAVGDGTLRADRVRALPLLPGTVTTAATALTSFEAPAVGAAAPSAALGASFVGVIGARTGSDSFTLGDVEVALLDSTLVVGGGRNALVPGARVQVTGRIVAAGRVEATRIDLQ